MPAPSAKTPRSPAAADISPREAAFLMTGVFLMFAPVMVLAVSDLAPDRPLRTFLFWSVVSGATAAVWAGLGMLRPRLLPLAAVLQFAVVALFATQLPRPFAIGVPRVSVEGLGSILTMAAGYVLFIVFIRRQSHQKMRLELEGARMQTELDLASQIHRALVPDITRRVGPLEVHARSLASGEMGGDLMEVIEHEWGGGEGRRSRGGGVVDVCLADVSGHGVRAGVVMGMVKSAIRTRLLAPTPLHDLVGDLNRVLAGAIEPGMFATFAALRFHPSPDGDPSSAMRVEYCLAGHLPIFHIHADPRESGPAVIDLPNDRLPLGLAPEETYTCGHTTARRGDLFALYTDGLTEVAGADARQLTHDGLRPIIARHAHLPLPEAHAAILQAVESHGPQGDDQTLVLVRVL